MADTRNFGLVGVGSNVQHGKGGPRVKANGTAVEIKNAADNAFAVLRVGDPIGLDDAVNRRYVETKVNVIVTGQIWGSAPPVVVSGAVYICTVTGGAYTAGRLYFGENAVWNEITPPEGMTISVTDALTGGTLTFAADHRFLWDSDGSVWVDLGPAPAETKLVKAIRLSLSSASGSSAVSIGSALPVNAQVTKVILNVTQAWNGTAPTVTFGTVASPAELGASSESDLKTLGTYIIDCYKLYATSTQLVATPTQDGSTVGAGTVEVHYSLV